MLGQTETRDTEEGMTVVESNFGISRETMDKKIAICSLRTATDRFKENYNIDTAFTVISVTSSITSSCQLTNVVKEILVVTCIIAHMNVWSSNLHLPRRSNNQL